jgi:hypothetical protein
MMTLTQPQSSTAGIAVDPLRTAVATLTAAHPTAACRIERAARLVTAAAVTPIYGIGYLVASESEPERSYWVQRVNDVLTCECPDYRNRGANCKHGWAAILFAACERLDAEQRDPTVTAVIPFPLPAYDPNRDRFVLTAQGHAALASPEHTPA